MKNLKGSEKQVKWANDIVKPLESFRDKIENIDGNFLASFDEKFNLSGKSFCGLNQKTNLLTAIDSILNGKAEWIISNRHLLERSETGVRLILDSNANELFPEIVFNFSRLISAIQEK